MKTLLLILALGLASTVGATLQTPAAPHEPGVPSPTTPGNECGHIPDGKCVSILPGNCGVTSAGDRVDVNEGGGPVTVCTDEQGRLSSVSTPNGPAHVDITLAGPGRTIDVSGDPGSQIHIAGNGSTITFHGGCELGVVGDGNTISNSGPGGIVTVMGSNNTVNHLNGSGTPTTYTAYPQAGGPTNTLNTHGNGAWETGENSEWNYIQ